MNPKPNSLFPAIILLTCLGALWCVAHLLLDADSAVHRAVFHGRGP